MAEVKLSDGATVTAPTGTTYVTLVRTSGTPGNEKITPDNLINSSASSRLPAFWVNFDGTGAGPITPRADFNVTNITKNSTGNYTINFTTALASANYAVVCSGVKSNAIGAVAMVVNPKDLATGSVRVVCDYNNGTPDDFDQIHVIGYI